ncbi:2-isopropylmalate synthase [Tolypothrix campylonemoides VB511288]|nr:2-isopropylmalate synthase [Tolypothrix campylonemoides VB511288]
MLARNLIYNWNESSDNNLKSVKLCDETLRDGLEGGVNRIPSLEEKLDLLSLANASGINDAMVGFPSQDMAYKQALALCKGAEIRGLDIRFGLLGRMVEADIHAIESIRQRSSHPVIAHLFIPCSPIRRYVEQWEVDELERLTRFGVGLATQLGLPVNFSPEDTSRAEPEIVERLCQAAIEEGATEITVCDTVGYLTPTGTQQIVQHLRHFLNEKGFKVRLDFHGHNDRGLALVNSLAAVNAGVDCIQGTILGIGERAGNAPLDLIMINLQMQGLWNRENLVVLREYCMKIAQFCELKIPDKYPIFGANSFLTQMGVHASAILKAELQQNKDIAAYVYSGVDPSLVGLDYGIQVGPYSGRANVRFLLHRKGIEVVDEIVDEILTKARIENRILANEEVFNLVKALI